MSLVLDRSARSEPARTSILREPSTGGQDTATKFQDGASRNPLSPISRTYVPGPFNPVYPSGPKPSISQNGSLEEPGFASGGFHPHALKAANDEAGETYCHEPQSVVVTAMFVGLVLAGMGYAFGIR